MLYPYPLIKNTPKLLTTKKTTEPANDPNKTLSKDVVYFLEMYDEKRFNRVI